MHCKNAQRFSFSRTVIGVKGLPCIEFGGLAPWCKASLALPLLVILLALVMALLLPGFAGAAPFAYISNQYSNSVSVIDTANNTVVATVPVGNGPLGVAVNPAGTRAYVANAYSNTVSVIDTASNSVIATVPVGTYPWGMAMNPSGTRAYVSN